MIIISLRNDCSEVFLVCGNRPLLDCAVIILLDSEAFIADKQSGMHEFCIGQNFVYKCK